MNDKYPCVENLYEIEHGTLSVRIWTDITNGTKYEDGDIYKLYAAVLNYLDLDDTNHDTLLEVIKANMKDRVNAMQVSEINLSDGHVRKSKVIYTVDFNDNIHG